MVGRGPVPPVARRGPGRPGHGPRVVASCVRLYGLTARPGAPEPAVPTGMGSSALRPNAPWREATGRCSLMRSVASTSPGGTPRPVSVAQPLHRLKASRRRPAVAMRSLSSAAFVFTDGDREPFLRRRQERRGRPASGDRTPRSKVTGSGSGIPSFPFASQPAADPGQTTVPGSLVDHDPRVTPVPGQRIGLGLPREPRHSPRAGHLTSSGGRRACRCRRCSRASRSGRSGSRSGPGACPTPRPRRVGLASGSARSGRPAFGPHVKASRACVASVPVPTPDDKRRRS